MTRLLYHFHLFLSRISSLISQEKQLFAARFARFHEVHHLLSPTLENLGTSLLLGLSSFDHIACVRPAKQRRELGNLLICAPPRSGKSLLAIAQALTWKHSLIVNDIKGELYEQTAGYRATLGPVYVIDPVAGVGNRYDPFAARTTERQLSTLAHHLLFDPADKEPIFIQRAIKMLTQMTRAARFENEQAGTDAYRLLPYVGKLINTRGLKGTAEHLQALSPDLATKFLSGEFADKDFDGDRFLNSAWDSLDARLWPLLTDEVLRCFNGSDFTAEDLMLSKKPVTVYLRFHESELAALAPLVRLLFGSLIDGLIATYDRTQGKGCRPVLLLADEAGRTAIPMLADAASTVLGRRIYLWIAVQSLAHLELLYGRARAQVLRDTVETQLYFRPTDTQTARYLEERLGLRSDYAHSQTLHNGLEASEGRSERPVPLLPSQDIFLLADSQLLAFHRDNRPLRLSRLVWSRFPLLTKRQAIAPPALSPLPALSESVIPSRVQEPTGDPSWRLTHELLHGKGHKSSTNGFRKQAKP